MPRVEAMAEVRQHNRSGYVAGCRCGTCEEAHRAYMREYMRGYRLGIRAADRA